MMRKAITNQIGCFLFPQMVLRRFKKIATKIGRPEARFHALRHAYAVTALQEGADIKTVQSNFGHSTVSFTLDVYGHVSEKIKLDSTVRMESFIQKMIG